MNSLSQRPRCERPSRRVHRTNPSSRQRAVNATQSQRHARRPRRARVLSLQFRHRRREQGLRERRQRLRRRGAHNGYRADATPTGTRGSRTRRTISMQHVTGVTLTRFFKACHLSPGREHAERRPRRGRPSTRNRGSPRAAIPAEGVRPRLRNVPGPVERSAGKFWPRHHRTSARFDGNNPVVRARRHRVARGVSASPFGSPDRHIGNVQSSVRSVGSPYQTGPMPRRLPPRRRGLLGVEVASAVQVRLQCLVEHEQLGRRRLGGQPRLP